MYGPEWIENVISTLKEVEWVGRYEQEDKLAPELHDLLYGEDEPPATEAQQIPFGKF